MRVIDCEQGSDEWRLARLGKVGASMVADATAKDRSGKGWGITRKRLVARLAAERLTGNLTETYKSPSMDRGNEVEPEARNTYAFVHGVEVRQVGLVLHPTIDGAVASPDGLVGDDGLVQFKCPDQHTHMDTLLGASIDGGYMKQLQWEMACTGRQWSDFTSFDPRWPGEMQLHVRRVKRDPVMIAELETQVSEFLAEVARTVDQLIAVYRMPMAAE
jgi:hypothetical protein